MKGKSLIWGILLIVGGILFLLNNLEVLTINFDGWWTAFIIIPSVIGLFYKGERVISALGLILGILLLIAAQDLIYFETVWQIFVPVLIIMVGLSILFKPKFNVSRLEGRNNFIGVFGGDDVKITDEFKGASCIGVFGGITLDLADAQITEDIVIDSVSVFGGHDIILPKGVTVKSSGISIFGGVDDRYKDESDDKKPIVYINHVTVFGGVDVK